MMQGIGRQFINIDTWNEQLEMVGPVVEGEECNITLVRKDIQDMVEKAKWTIENINNIHSEVTKHWAIPTQRVIGHVIHAPGIAVDEGPRHFTQDWALIELYVDKFDMKTFQGNKVYIGGNISPADFLQKMNPHPDEQSDFKYPKYPPSGLLQVKGVVKDDEIRKPQQLDHNGEKCLFVTKRGRTTGTTFGCLSGMKSFVRTYGEYNTKKTSIEIAVYSYSNKDGAFSAPGDSGSIVLDSRGRAVGMLVVGAGKMQETDVTYLTPYWWIEQEMKKVYPDISLY